MRSIYICFLALLLACLTVNGQNVPLGGWKDYLSYSNALTVTSGQNVIYCAASTGLFSYNTSDNAIEKLNKVTGLSDVNPTVARFNSADNVLVIGYSDGNMDFIRNKTITNLPVLNTSSVQGSKAINCICFYNSNGNYYAYIGCGQGIMQVDLTQDVILNTYYLGVNATALNVRDITITNTDTIFAATDKGIFKASINDPNLNYYAEWQKVPTSILPLGKGYYYNAIVAIGDSVYANYTAGLWTQDTIYVYSNGQWSKCTFIPYSGNYCSSLKLSQVGSKNYLVASTLYGLFTINMQNPQPGGATDVNNYGWSGSNSMTANDALLDANMNAWVADNNFGLVKVKDVPGSVGTNFTPSGPFNNQVFNMAISNGDLWIAPAEYLTYNATGPSILENGNWSYINQFLKYGQEDLNCVAIDPFNPMHGFIGCYEGGLLEILNNSVVNLWNASNSTLQNISGTPSGSYSSRIGGVAFDTLGNLWVTNSIPSGAIYMSVYKTNQSWEYFNFNVLGSALPQSSVVNNVFITQSQAKWLLFNNTAIVAYQDNGTAYTPNAPFAAPTTGNTQVITTTPGDGGLPDLNVNCMAEDQNGSIWVGLDVQVVVFYSPDNVFDGNHDWDAQPVYVTQNGYTQYLMQNQSTTAIAIDGANRKWIGTQGGGVFLMSADGTQQILNFTSSNSPLLSNNIQSIVINPINGEVFIGTDKGIVSYRGSATEGLSTFGNVYAFPDPVPHDYSGPITITNLVTNADVRITTVNGELVYHTIALGGQAIWNGVNFDGRRVQTGVYLVFCASPDGSQTKVAKLLFIN
ncbi:MAG: two-component regulator propeller domain-containing protein [Bacteroidia bacterium]